MPSVSVNRKRSWYSDPAGWAEDYLSSPSGYLSSSLVCCMGAALSVTIVWLLSSRADSGLSDTWYFYLGAVLFSGAIPFVFLRAAHHHLLRSKHDQRESAV